MKKKPKDPAAVSLGKRRAKTLDAAHQSAAGKARAAALTPERRSEIARNAALAKAAKRKSQERPE